MMLNRLLLSTIVLSLATQTATASAHTTASQKPTRPNIVLIYVDDMGYGDASCLNPNAKFKTANIDRLAKEGLTFTDGHSSDAVCTPSRYSLLTGRYSWRTRLKRGVMGAEGPCLIAPGRMTLASFLRQQGYRTAMVGKWHLGMVFPGAKGKRDWKQPVRDMPLDRGFDYFYGIPASMNYGVLAYFEGRHAKVPPTMFTRKRKSKIALADYRIAPPYAKTSEGGNTLEVAPDFVDGEVLTRFTDKALAWLGPAAAKAKEGTPFFLYLAYTSPHKPVIPIKRFRGKSKAGAYGDFMIETDWHIGRVLKKLDDAGVADNTILIFTSDNGPENTWRQRIVLYQHFSAWILRGGKRSIYEGGHRVPFLVRWPARIKGGRHWHGPVCQTDLLATFAELLGKQLPDNAGEDSVSFCPILFDDKTNIKPRLPLIHHSAKGRFAIRSGRWTLVMETKKAKNELYDMKADLSQKKDVAAQHPEVVQQLRRQITTIVTNGRTTPGRPQKNDMPYWQDLTWMKRPNQNN